MHSIIIPKIENADTEEQCTSLIHALENSKYVRVGQKFLATDIKKSRIPLLHLIYPILQSISWQR